MECIEGIQIWRRNFAKVRAPFPWPRGGASYLSRVPCDLDSMFDNLYRNTKVASSQHGAALKDFISRMQRQVGYRARCRSIFVICDRDAGQSGSLAPDQHRSMKAKRKRALAYMRQEEGFYGKYKVDHRGDYVRVSPGTNT